MQLNFAVRRSLLDEIDSGHIGTKMSVLIRGMYSFQGLIYNVKVCILNVLNTEVPSFQWSEVEQFYFADTLWTKRHRLVKCPFFRENIMYCV